MGSSELGRADLASMVADNVELPADAIYEILLRVPAKDLCRLRLVCRSWRSLTSDPSFIRAHSARHPLFTGFRRLEHEIYVIDVHSGSIVRRMKKFNTENLSESNPRAQGDLVCISGSTRDEFRSRARVLDLITGVTTVLPVGGIKSDQALTVCILGHVPSTGEHKLLRVGYDPDLYGSPGVAHTKYQRCEVITLATDNNGGGQRWRETSTHPSVPVFVADPRLTAVIDGVIHFLMDDLSLDDFPGIKADSVFSFDLSTEAWTTIEGPLSTHLGVAKIRHSHRMANLKLANVNGCLVMIHHGSAHRSTDLWFLEVKMGKESWTKRYSLQYVSQPNGFAFRPYPMVVLDDGRVLAWFINTHSLRAYDPTRGTWEDFAMLEGYFGVAMYGGSLLRPGLQVDKFLGTSINLEK